MRDQGTFNDLIAESNSILAMHSLAAPPNAPADASLPQKPLGMVQARIERRCRAFIESAPDALIIVTPDGRIVVVNGRAETITGYPRQELLDLYVRRKGGTEFAAEISSTRVETEDGAFVISAIRDMTRHRATLDLLHFVERDGERRFCVIAVAGNPYGEHDQRLRKTSRECEMSVGIGHSDDGFLDQIAQRVRSGPPDLPRVRADVEKANPVDARAAWRERKKFSSPAEPARKVFGGMLR